MNADDRDRAAAKRRLARYWFHVRMVAMVVAVFVFLLLVSEWGNKVLDVIWLEPPCSDGAAWDGECRLEVS